MLKALGTKLKVNDISPEYAKELNKRFDKQFPEGKGKVSYRFKIESHNPDPEKTGGPFIYPALHQIQPVTFHITDPFSKARVKIGLPLDQLDGNGDPVGYRHLKLVEHDRGVFTLNVEKHDDKEAWFYMELQIGNEKGDFYNPNSEASRFNRIDETGEAMERNKKRDIRRDSMLVADGMTAKEIRNYAMAIGWDATEHLEILKDKVSRQAETDPEFFKNFIEASNFEMKALVSRAERAGIIEWNHLDSKYVWGATKEVIVSLGRKEGNERLSAMADWLLTDSQGRLLPDKLTSLLQTTEVSA